MPLLSIHYRANAARMQRCTCWVSERLLNHSVADISDMYKRYDQHEYEKGNGRGLKLITRGVNTFHRAIYWPITIQLAISIKACGFRFLYT